MAGSDKIPQDLHEDAGTLVDDCTKRIKGASNKIGSAKFRKAHDDTRDPRTDSSWKKAMDAVGYIMGPVYGGTGFRVGKDKVLTAYHVVEDVASKTDPPRLTQDDLSIKFGFPMNDVPTKKNIPSDRTSETYYFEEDFTYDKELDFAVLTLRNKTIPEASGYPNPITLFKCPEKTVAIIGHPGGKRMQLDPNIQIFDPLTEEGRNRVNDMKEWACRKGKKGAYGDILDKKDDGKVLFDCWVQQGASGAPGIEINSNGEPVCSLMLTGGYPNFVFEKGYTIQEEDYKYMVEQGVTMKAIADKLDRLGPEAQKIKQEIFADNKFN